MQDTLNIVKGQKPQNIKTLPQNFANEVLDLEL